MDSILNIGLALGILFIAQMYKNGSFRGKQNNRLAKIINFDDFIFPYIDKRLVDKADQWSSIICIVMAILTAVNGVLILVSPKVPNESMIFLVVAIPGAMIFRTIFIFMKR